MRIISKILDGAIITVTRETKRFVWLDIYENDNVALEVQIDLQKRLIVGLQINEPSLEKLNIATLVLEKSKNIIEWVSEE
jgi:hypothetical protein